MAENEQNSEHKARVLDAVKGFNERSNSRDVGPGLPLPYQKAEISQ